MTLCLHGLGLVFVSRSLSVSVSGGGLVRSRSRLQSGKTCSRILSVWSRSMLSQIVHREILSSWPAGWEQHAVSFWRRWFGAMDDEC
jgi:hypothetical protein